MKSNRFWAIVITVLLVVACAVSVIVFSYRGVGHVVGIYQNGQLIKQIHLDTVTVPYTFTVETPDGGYNVVSVEQGRICVVEASCPDGVCVDTGWISDGLIPIVCLPNELVIRFEGNEANGVDGAVQ